MNTQSNTVPESPIESQVITPAPMSPTRPLYWSVWRELWENRSIYIVPLIESDDPFGEETTAAVREYAEPLKSAAVDTVILGCTHYPLIRPIFQRVFGRDVTLVFSAEETAREVAETLARKGIENGEGREGGYRFLTTGPPDAFRAMGARFLQLPITEVEHVEPARLEAAAA